MKQTLTKDTFRFLFNQIRPDNFSYEGLGELFDYLEQCDECSDSEMEFDPIAICCDFSQCSLDEFLDSFKIDCEKVASNTYKKTVIDSYIEKNGFWFAFVEEGKEVVFENF